MFSLSGCGETAAESETRTVYAMDTVMNLTVYGEKAASALENAEKELHTLDGAVLSRTAEGSELSALNAANGEAVSYAADDPLPKLIETALTISEATDGAFDPTLAPVLDAWGFTKDLRRVPSSDELAALLARTGRDKIALEKTADGYLVTLSGGAQLDLGGIAKGYAADLLRAQLEKEGVTSATLDLGGDVFVMGKKSDGSDWRIAVKDPGDTESYLGIVSASDAFIVTSGVYERYFEENGVRYHHILDPKTGCPAESGLVSVTVLCKNGAWADALSTACFVLGTDKALALRDGLAAQGRLLSSFSSPMTGTCSIPAALPPPLHQTRKAGTPMNRSPKLKPTLWDALVVLAVLALAGLLAARPFLAAKIGGRADGQHQCRRRDR